MLVRLPSFSNMFIIRLVLIPNQQLEQISQRRKFKLMDKLLPYKFGIQLAKKNSNHLVLHSTEEQIAVLFALILLILPVSTHLITGRPDLLKTQDPMIQNHSHLFLLEIRLIEKVRERLQLKKHRRGAKKIMICSILRHQPKKAKVSTKHLLRW